MASTETSRAEALDALLADRRRHEGYLQRLEERRAATPVHLFDRLHAEYTTRLTDLRRRAQAEAAALSEGLAEDEAAVTEVEARLAVMMEERAEGELRAAVGEFDPRSWAKKLAALNAGISAVEGERDARLAALEHRRALLAEASGAGAGPPIPDLPAVPPPQILPIVTEPVAAVTPMVESVPASTADAAAEAAVDASEEPAEGGKSLACEQCGTLNFPTEWYCERCGGELAAL